MCYHMMNHLGKFIVLFLLFVAFVPGVVLTLGSKQSSLYIHAALFALTCSVLAHVVWCMQKQSKQSQQSQQLQGVMISLA